MALVICCVFLTLRMRRRMSIRLGISYASLRPAFAAADVNRCLNSLSTVLICCSSARRQSLLLADRLQHPGLRVLHKPVELGFEPADIFHRNIVEDSRCVPAKMISTCFSTGKRRVLALLQNFDQALAAIELLLRSLVEIRAELRERRQFAILRQFQTQATGDLSAWL